MSVVLFCGVIKMLVGFPPLKNLQFFCRTTWDTVLTEESSAVAPEVFRQGRQLGLRLDKVWRAAADGKLGLLRADLPDHYLATDKVTYTPIPNPILTPISHPWPLLGNQRPWYVQPCLCDWETKGLGMSSRVCVTG